MTGITTPEGAVQAHLAQNTKDFIDMLLEDYPRGLLLGTDFWEGIKAEAEGVSECGPISSRALTRIFLAFRSPSSSICDNVFTLTWRSKLYPLDQLSKSVMRADNIKGWIAFILLAVAAAAAVAIVITGAVYCDNSQSGASPESKRRRSSSSRQHNEVKCYDSALPMLLMIGGGLLGVVAFLCFTHFLEILEALECADPVLKCLNEKKQSDIVKSALRLEPIAISGKDSTNVHRLRHRARKVEQLMELALKSANSEVVAILLVNGFDISEDCPTCIKMEFDLFSSLLKDDVAQETKDKFLNMLVVLSAKQKVYINPHSFSTLMSIAKQSYKNSVVFKKHFGLNETSKEQVLSHLDKAFDACFINPDFSLPKLSSMPEAFSSAESFVGTLAAYALSRQRRSANTAVTVKIMEALLSLSTLTLHVSIEDRNNMQDYVNANSPLEGGLNLSDIILQEQVSRDVPGPSCLGGAMV